MDISDDYKHMCKEAVDLRETWSPTSGDFYVYSYDSPPMPILFDNMTNQSEIHILCRPSIYSDKYIISTTHKGETRTLTADEFTRETCIWLPRIDQLIRYIGTSDVLEELGTFIQACDSKSKRSLEQLMLEYVMFIRFHKVWDGELRTFKREPPQS